MGVLRADNRVGFWPIVNCTDIFSSVKSCLGELPPGRGGPPGRAHPRVRGLWWEGEGTGCVCCCSLIKTTYVFLQQAPFCCSSSIVREETKQNREVEVDSIISAVSSLFIQDLQRSINLLLS